MSILNLTQSIIYLFRKSRYEIYVPSPMIHCPFKRRLFSTVVAGIKHPVYGVVTRTFDLSIPQNETVTFIGLTKKGKPFCVIQTVAGMLKPTGKVVKVIGVERTPAVEETLRALQEVFAVFKYCDSVGVLGPWKWNWMKAKLDFYKITDANLVKLPNPTPRSEINFHELTSITEVGGPSSLLRQLMELIPKTIPLYYSPQYKTYGIILGASNQPQGVCGEFLSLHVVAQRGRILVGHLNGYSFHLTGAGHHRYHHVIPTGYHVVLTPGLGKCTGKKICTNFYKRMNPTTEADEQNQ